MVTLLICLSSGRDCEKKKGEVQAKINLMSFSEDSIEQLQTVLALLDNQDVSDEELNHALDVLGIKLSDIKQIDRVVIGVTKDLSILVPYLEKQIKKAIKSSNIDEGSIRVEVR